MAATATNNAVNECATANDFVGGAGFVGNDEFVEGDEEAGGGEFVEGDEDAGGGELAGDIEEAGGYRSVHVLIIDNAIVDEFAVMHLLNYVTKYNVYDINM